MREILFRGKSENDGNWVQGSLVVTTIEPADGNPIKHYHIEDMTIGVFPNGFQSGLSETVDPPTVGQFTGLTDKNGKLIFEGDIVRCGTGRICKVTFFISPSVSGFDLVPIGGFDAPPPHNWSLFADTEVIGNIHDNPELLEV